MKEKANIGMKNIIYLIILMITIVVGGIVYSKYNYHDFNKSVRERGKTTFSRDANVKYSKVKSYKLENQDYNDAMFYKKVQIKENTPYRITCMIKTEDVESEKQTDTGGAQIGIIDSMECSQSIKRNNRMDTINFHVSFKK